MALKNQHLILARKFLGALTWKKILGVFVVCLFLLSIIFLVLHKSDRDLSKSSVSGLLMNIPLGIRNDIDAVVKKSPLIIGIQVTTIRFSTNTQVESYSSFDNPEAQAIFDNYLNNKVVDTPLFGENKSTNRILLRLLSGEFVCTAFAETSVYSRTPQFKTIVTDVCSLAVPPYHGDFTGIFNIYLESHPTKDDTERLFLLSRDFSLKIYEENKNVKKENHR